MDDVAAHNRAYRYQVERRVDMLADVRQVDLMGLYGEEMDRLTAAAEWALRQEARGLVTEYTLVVQAANRDSGYRARQGGYGCTHTVKAPSEVWAQAYAIQAHAVECMGVGAI